MDEAGEETDEGDMESREVDYMTDASSNSEMEFLVSLLTYQVLIFKTKTLRSLATKKIYLGVKWGVMYSSLHLLNAFSVFFINLLPLQSPGSLLEA